MTDRTIRTYLRVEIADFKRQMAEAAKETDKLGAAFDKNGQKIQTTSGKIVRSAQLNRESWTTAGSALTAFGAGITALGAAALKTGIEYNTLQQTSRAALTTLLGDAKAANEQMDKLDDFARTSPFAKQVFIMAQRQMLGFGIEAGKVIPYLDSIQNAVAAMGGSNEQISSISEILSKIASQGKITARELMQLGINGIDAATLIGDQMGFTGAEIRKQITKGAIGAGEALDALAAGMQERFGGAAANVKNTFDGAVDRVKAAWRDLSSELASPLVDPKGGGGLAVDWANNLADAMRQFQALPEPVKETIVVATGLVGVISLLGGGFLLLAPRILATKTALDVLGISMGKTAAVAGRLMAVLAVMMAASNIPKWGTSTAVGANEAADAMLAFADGADIAATSLGNFLEKGGVKDWFTGNDIDSLKDMFGVLADPSVGQNIDNIASSILSFGQTTSTNRLEAEKFFATVDAGLATLAGSGDVEGATRSLEALANEIGVSSDELLTFLPAYRDTMAGTKEQMDLAAASASDLGTEIEQVSEEVKKAQDAYEAWRGMLADANSSFIDLGGAYQSVIDKNRALAQATADSTKSTKDSWETYYNGTKVSMKDFVKELEGQVKALEKWRDNTQTIAERVGSDLPGWLQAAGTEMLDELIAQGESGSPLVKALAKSSDADFRTVVELYREKGALAADEWADSIEAGRAPTVAPVVSMTEASAAYYAWVAEVEARDVKVPITWNLNAQGNVPSITAPQRRAGGGGVFGPGTGTSDSILARLSNGEHVWTAREVAAAGGHGAVAAMRRYMVKGYADGGPVTPQWAGSPQVVTVPVNSTHESYAPMSIGTVVASDVADFERQMRLRQREAVFGGNRL